MSPAITVEKLTKKFGRLTAVDNLDFSLNKGEVVGFVGPNGAGKTTAISLLMGFLRASSGKITIEKTVVRPETAHSIHHKVGYAAGDMELFDNLTAAQYLSFLKYRYGNADEQQSLIKRLQPKMGQKLKHLSRGNKQKVALIGAFGHNPEIAILDEPTSGLDPLMQEVFLDLIREQQAKGTTIFMSSHILSEVASVCSRVIFMKRGKIVTDQPVKKLEESAGKIITVTTSATDIKQITAHLLDGTKVVSKSTKTVKLRYSGDIRRLMRWLNTHPISDITIADIELDDIFHDMYKMEDEG